jgi:ribosomal protein S18 acetylase RimI-like enzyme
MATTPLVTTPAEATAHTESRAVDTGRAVATLVEAFAEDPVVRWFFPDATGYLTAFPEVLRLTSDGAAPAGTIDLLDGGTGAAIWHRPGTASPDEALAGLVATYIPTSRHATVYGFLEQMSGHHPDSATVWYLPFVGVVPTRQGQGHGSVLLQGGLARVDRDGLPAYLEASSARNRALYERHGFEAVGEIRVADSPPMWPMLRRPR